MAIGPPSGIPAPPAENNVLQNFSDATAGRSLQLYHCVASRTSAATTYVLARDAGISSPTTTDVTGSTKEINFDITINKSTLISGTGYVDVTFNLNVNGTAKITFEIIHYDGSTETSLTGAIDTPTITVAGSESFKVPLSFTKKNFRVGDILRLETILEGGAGDKNTLSHDPLTAGDELKLWVPVVNLE